MKRILFGTGIVLILSGCGIHSYSPTLTHYPQPDDKGKISVTTSLGEGGFNVSAAGGISNSVGLSALLHTNIYTGRSEASERRRIGEASIYMMGELEEGSNFYGGFVLGGGAADYMVYNKRMYDHYDRFVNSKSNYNYLYASPFMLKASSNGVFNIIFAFKFSYLFYHSYYLECADQDYEKQNYDVVIKGEEAHKNPTKIIWEPTLRWSFGKKYFRFFNQITIPATIDNKVRFSDQLLKGIKDYPVPSIQFGMILSLPLSKQKDK
ncbi:MAG: membrane lipoprotein lipid attachment site-containing protein [Bacteroidetes bacterium]|jgi:hypothetical protein|nr:membrane lipoprotein lipid attachment site-containing protein [Bacteroidota bacterium]